MSEADLRAYHDRKRPMAVWSAAVGAIAAGALATRWPLGGIALATGTACGIANAFLTMRSNERMADHRMPSVFVISSILRIVVFAIVPVEFALRGPVWTMAAYFTGFFMPLALYTALVARAVRTEQR